MDFSYFPSAFIVYIFLVILEMVSGTTIPQFENLADAMAAESVMQKIYALNSKEYIEEELTQEQVEAVFMEIENFARDNAIAHEMDAIRTLPTKDLVRNWIVTKSINYQSLNLSDDCEKKVLESLIPVLENTRCMLIYIIRQAALIPREQMSYTMTNWASEFLGIFLNGYFEDCKQISLINQKRVEFLQGKHGEARKFALHYIEWSEGEGRAMPSFRPIDPEARGCTNYEALLDSVFREACYPLEEYANHLLDLGLIDPQMFVE